MCRLQLNPPLQLPQDRSCVQVTYKKNQLLVRRGKGTRALDYTAIHAPTSYIHTRGKKNLYSFLFHCTFNQQYGKPPQEVQVTSLYINAFRTRATHDIHSGGL